MKTMNNPYTETQQKRMTQLYELIQFYEEINGSTNMGYTDCDLKLYKLRTQLAYIENSVPENLKG